MLYRHTLGNDQATPPRRPPTPNVNDGIPCFSQAVQGTPTLKLNSGPDAKALYLHGGGNDSVLTFLYTVSEGQSTLDLDTDGRNALSTPDGSSILVSVQILGRIPR